MRWCLDWGWLAWALKWKGTSCRHTQQEWQHIGIDGGLHANTWKVNVVWHEHWADLTATVCRPLLEFTYILMMLDMICRCLPLHNLTLNNERSMRRFCLLTFCSLHTHHHHHQRHIMPPEIANSCLIRFWCTILFSLAWIWRYWHHSLATSKTLWTQALNCKGPSWNNCVVSTNKAK